MCFFLPQCFEKSAVEVSIIASNYIAFTNSASSHCLILSRIVSDFVIYIKPTKKKITLNRFTATTKPRRSWNNSFDFPKTDWRGVSPYIRTDKDSIIFIYNIGNPWTCSSSESSSLVKTTTRTNHRHSIFWSLPINERFLLFLKVFLEIIFKYFPWVVQPNENCNF